MHGKERERERRAKVSVNNDQLHLQTSPCVVHARHLDQQWPAMLATASTGDARNPPFTEALRLVLDLYLETSLSFFGPNICVPKICFD